MCAGRARADTPASPLRTNDYALEFYQGPLIAPIRVTGFAGAYTAIAEGVEGAASNAAAPAVREPFSHHWFDYDLSAALSFPGAFARTDFDNRGTVSSTSSTRFGQFLYLNLGAQAQLGSFGTSATVDLQQFTVAPSDGGSPLQVQLARWHLLAGYGVFGDQLVLGFGLRALSLRISTQENLVAEGNIVTGGLFTMAGLAPEAGVLYRPDNQPWRIGATVRAPVTARKLGAGNTTTDPDGVVRAGDLVLPEKAILPWEVELGVAVQAGPRPLNPPWINPHTQEQPVRDAIDRARAEREAANADAVARAPAAERPSVAAEILRREAHIREVEDARLEAERARLLAVRKARYANWPREKILFVASVLATGVTEDAVAVEGFLDHRDERVGRRITLMPRAGIESEPIVGWLRMRGGSYVEPSRFESGTARQHFTAGADVKLFPFDAWGIFAPTIWRASFAIDLAPRYANWGFGIGAWH